MDLTILNQDPGQQIGTWWVKTSFRFLWTVKHLHLVLDHRGPSWRGLECKCGSKQFLKLLLSDFYAIFSLEKAWILILIHRETQTRMHYSGSSNWRSGFLDLEPISDPDAFLHYRWGKNSLISVDFEEGLDPDPGEQKGFNAEKSNWKTIKK